MRSCCSFGVRVVVPVEWTRSNRYTGMRHLFVELVA